MDVSNTSDGLIWVHVQRCPENHFQHFWQNHSPNHEISWKMSIRSLYIYTYIYTVYIYHYHYPLKIPSWNIMKYAYGKCRWMVKSPRNPWVFPARDAQESATPGKGSEKRCKDASRCHAQARGPGGRPRILTWWNPKVCVSTGGYLFIYIYCICIYNLLYMYI